MKMKKPLLISLNLCKKFNIKMINKLSEVDTLFNLAYFNRTVLKNRIVLKNKDDFNINQNIICRKY